MEIKEAVCVREGRLTKGAQGNRKLIATEEVTFQGVDGSLLH